MEIWYLYRNTTVVMEWLPIEVLEKWGPEKLCLRGRHLLTNESSTFATTVKKLYSSELHAVYLAGYMRLDHRAVTVRTTTDTSSSGNLS